MRVARARYHELLTNTIERHGGRLFKVVEDGLCSVFLAAHSAAAASLDAQRALQAEAWPENIRLAVRMALNTGAVELREGEYFGQPLNRVSKILSAGHGGQILLSEVTQRLVEDALPEGVSFKNLGRHRLKDLGSPEPIFQLICPELASDFPPLSSLDNPLMPNNLPHQVTSFIGRETEIREVETLLCATRLLTVTGSAGCGKSRLCMHVAADLLSKYRDGVWLIELSSTSESSLVPEAIASVFGLRAEPTRQLKQTLVDYFKPRQLLLVFDNCEHLLDACADLAVSLLQGCAEVQILASSREAIGIAAEQVFRLPPLSLPDPRQEHTEKSLDSFEAVRLFIDRAIAVQPHFTVTDANARTLAQVCVRLDGIPLAIEFAAARIRSLTVEQLNARLDARFRLLTGGGRAALPQHQTLRALIDWSFDLLEDEEKALFVRLSVFGGGWSLHAAESICSGDGIEDYEMLGLLMALVDKSLVIYDDRGPEASYRMLETVRQYAADRLSEGGSSNLYRSRHRDYYLARAQQAVSKLNGPGRDLESARAMLEESLNAFVEVEDHTGVAYCLESMAKVFSEGEEPDRAARLWGASERIREELGEPGPTALSDGCEEHLRVTRNAMGEEAFASAWATGRSMSFEQAMQCALAQSIRTP
jgi:predicted ATPase